MQMNLFTKEKQIERLKESIYGYERAMVRG